MNKSNSTSSSDHTSNSLRVLLLGGSGAVGAAVLQQALLEVRFVEVIAPTRRPLPQQAAKLRNPIIDFQNLDPQSPIWQVDAVICALGSTIKTAGSEAAFAAVDRDLPLQIARLTKAAGATRWALTSSLGASAKGNFYLRTKAQTEAGLAAIGFGSLSIVRPSLIDTEREPRRLGETLGLWVARSLRPLIPKRYRAVSPSQIASALLVGILRAPPGTTVIESDQLWP